MDINWQRDFFNAVRRAKLRVIGYEDIENDAQADVAAAILRAYGDSPAGFLYIEPCTIHSSNRPPDVVLCHPAVGLLVVEVKAYSLDFIEGVEAGNLIVRFQGEVRQINPLRQASQAMFAIRDEAKRVINHRWHLPLFSFMAAFPNISTQEARSHHYGKHLSDDAFLFSEHIGDIDLMKGQVGQVISAGMEKSKKDRPLNIDQVETLTKVFGDSAILNNWRASRDWVDQDKLGAVIDSRIQSHKMLSAEQQKLSRLKVGRFPRLVRGVAGSGKSVVLANLVARVMVKQNLHQYRMFRGKTSEFQRVAVLCFNRTLVPYLRQKIEDAYEAQTLQPLPDDALNVNSFNSFIWSISNEMEDLQYISTNKVRDAGKRAAAYREQIMEIKRLDPSGSDAILYDLIFVDEGQDLAPEEISLLLDLLRPDPESGEKGLIIFYDDAQNLYANLRPVWKDYGMNVIGGRSSVMKTCFRNTHEIAELAFNVLLGTKSSEEVRVQTRQFADVGYLKQTNAIEETGDHVIVNFADRTFDAPMVCHFKNRREEQEWVIGEIARLVLDEAVRPEDILLLCPQKWILGEIEGLLPSILMDQAVEGVIKAYKAKDDYIFREGHLTLSTPHSAKGYDAEVVFLMGVDLFKQTNEDRAAFYVGATRAKLLLYLTGIEKPGSMLDEAQAVCEVITGSNGHR